MERKLKLDDVREAVKEAYSKAKGIKDGKVDPRVAGTSPKKFGIAVVLNSGEVIAEGDDSATFPLGGISRMPVTVELLSQLTPEQIMEKNPRCHCHRDCGGARPFKAHAIRAISAIAPSGDPDGKMDILLNDLVNMAGAEPQLDDKLYLDLMEKASQADIENRMAEAGYELYDDAPAAIDIYMRLQSLTLSLRDVATMGASLAADGVNPVTHQNVCDPAVATRAIAFFARKGPHKSTRRWMMLTGLPARSSFAGAIVAIMPGFGAIAAYSPRVDGKGVSPRAAEAIRLIADRLGLNVYASERVTVE